MSKVQKRFDKFGGDGQYDKWSVYESLAAPASQASPIDPLIPPRKDAKIKQHGNTNKPPLARDQAIRAIRKKGRKKWNQDADYHRRSLAETAMARYKGIIGDHVNSKVIEKSRARTKAGL